MNCDEQIFIAVIKTNTKIEMLKKIIYFILISISFGCHAPKYLITNYVIYSHLNNDKLKIDGYYYKIDSATFSGERLEPRISWFILYSDGTLLQSFQNVSEWTNFQNFEDTHFNNPPEYYDYNKFSKKQNTWWGVYSITGSIITLQHFIFFNQWLAIERKGRIINETEIHFFNTKTLNGRDESVRDYDYSFRKFSNKPDSLNWMMVDDYYIKKKKAYEKIKQYGF